MNGNLTHTDANGNLVTEHALINNGRVPFETDLSAIRKLVPNYNSSKSYQILINIIDGELTGVTCNEY